jgi:sarcosine oxidase
MSTGQHVVVIGAGAMGAATAWRLASDGHRVTILEQFDVGHRLGSSHGPSRIFRVAYRQARYATLALAALDGWRNLEATTNRSLLRQAGQIDHGDPGAIDEIVANLAALDRPAETMSGTEAGRRWPTMRFGEAAVFSPDGGRVLADGGVRALLDAAAGAGAELRDRAAVTALEPAASGVTVQTSAGPIHADTVVVAAGAWASSLLAELVALAPLAVEQTQPVHFAPRVPTDDWISFIHHTTTLGGYGLWSDGIGVKVGLHDDRHPTDPDTPRHQRPEATAAVVDYVSEWIPGVDPTPIDVATCLYTSTPTEDFVLDRVGDIVVCSPCSGHGFKFAPAIGRVVADLVAGRHHAEAAWMLPRSG